MKTLNQYYDDSMGRSVVEVPDEEGRETRRNLSDFSHGCNSDAVQGGNPVDYDGSALNNTTDLASLPAQRIVGKGMVASPTRGTAEPEMRGLYILLTMNNDGGMEVMRYSAALYRDRPEIYNSKPVQLALNIFKVRLSGFLCFLSEQTLFILFFFNYSSLGSVTCRRKKTTPTFAFSVS